MWNVKCGLCNGCFCVVQGPPLKALIIIVLWSFCSGIKIKLCKTFALHSPFTVTPWFKCIKLSNAAKIIRMKQNSRLSLYKRAGIVVSDFCGNFKFLTASCDTRFRKWHEFRIWFHVLPKDVLLFRLKCAQVLRSQWWFWMVIYLDKRRFPFYFQLCTINHSFRCHYLSKKH